MKQLGKYEIIELLGSGATAETPGALFTVRFPLQGRATPAETEPSQPGTP